MAIFSLADIAEWIDDEQTALRPYCPVDSVISSVSSFPVPKHFLQSMHDHWF